MKVTMRMTLHGLVRALRLRAHGLAEEIEEGYDEMRRADHENEYAASRATKRKPMKEEGDECAGR